MKRRRRRRRRGHRAIVRSSRRHGRTGDLDKLDTGAVGHRRRRRGIGRGRRSRLLLLGGPNANRWYPHAASLTIYNCGRRGCR